MKLLKPSWVSHNGQPIFSVDIHPDGSRFATGGQGSDDSKVVVGRIVIWNMEPIREEIHEKDPNVPKILCTMESHFACVNCVRWSSDGKYLASASDDKLVMIWQASRQSDASNFGSSVVNAESWRVFSTLVGHTGDVIDVAWSSHDAWLASCSIDSTIIIWNALKFPEQITILRGHTGFTKGVSWDPVGNYLASQADDKTVRIWRTNDWKLEACIKEPFKECGGTTQALRLDWSPDGECLVTAHAMNNSGPTAQIIDRNGWKTNLDFVGHRRAVTCVRFSPRLMERMQSDGTKSEDYVVCAMGSRDRSISIWATCFKRPLVVLHDLFSQSVLDLTWAGNGTEMLCCSGDGTVAYFSFPPEEIGNPLSLQDKIATHKKLYGKTVLTSNDHHHTNNHHNNNNNIFIESVEFLQAWENAHGSQGDSHSSASKQPERENSQVVTEPECLKSDQSVSASSPVKTMNRQIESLTKDGRRKITPIFLAPQPDFGSGVPAPYTSFQQQAAPQFSSSTETSTIIVERSSTASEVTKVKENSSPPSELLPKTRSDEMPVSSAHPVVMDSMPSSSHPSDNNQPMDVTPTPTNLDLPEPMEVQNKQPVVQPSTPLHDNMHRCQEGIDDSKKKKDGRGRPRKDKLLDSNIRTSSYTNIQLPPSTPTSAMPQLVYESNNNNNVFNLPLLPRISSPQTHTVFTTSDPEERPYILESIRRFPHSDWLPPGIVRCKKNSVVVWETLLHSPIVASAATENIYSAICEDNTLHVHEVRCGRLMFPYIHLHGNPSIYQTRNHFVMVVTTSALLYLWDFKKLKCLIKNESMEHLFHGGSGFINKSWITEDGVPIFLLSNGKSYSYSKDMESWMLLTSKSNSVDMIADVFTCKNGVLDKVTPKIKPSQKAMFLHKSDQHSKELATIAYLEKQLACSLAMQSTKDYKEWMKLYARRLMHNGMDLKIRSLCQNLLAPLYNRKTTSDRSFGFTMGLDNLDLLKDLVGMMRDYPAFQRTYNEFQLQVEEFEGFYNL